MNSLPLSWSLINSEFTNSRIISNKRIKWFALQDLNANDFDYRILTETEENKQIVIRGCNIDLTNSLNKIGYSAFQFGMEAILDTSKNHFEKKSLKKLIKRGLRHGKIKKLFYSQENAKQLEEFRKTASHGNEPQLNNLFQTEFNPNNELYAFVDQNDNWLGIILTSRNSTEKIHTELILRKANAPIGIMEALVKYTFEDVKNERYKYLSLGEVPFIKNNKPVDLKSYIAYKVGLLLNFAYNYRGLYYFKNKFQPQWNELFICTSSKIKINHILFLLYNSNFHKLVFYKTFSRLKFY